MSAIHVIYAALLLVTLASCIQEVVASMTGKTVLPAVVVARPETRYVLPQVAGVGVRKRAAMIGSGASDEWDLVVPESDAELLAELRRHGVRPGQRLHLRAVPNHDADLMERAGVSRKRPPFRGSEGVLSGSVRIPTMEDFEDASLLARSDADIDPTFPE
jgi:hypothetical protein